MSEIEKLRLRFTSSNHIPIVSINYGVTDFELLEAEIQSLQSRNKVLTELLDEIVNKARYKYVPILATTKYKSTAGVQIKLHMTQIEAARKAINTAPPKQEK